MRSRIVSVVVCLALAACGFGDNGASRANTPACGDGVRDAGEGCDDGNTVGNDGCSPTCAVETSDPVCGNGVREVGEACDDGNTQSDDGCSAACEVESVCGNGVREVGEACDDGNTQSGDGCSATCASEQQGACTVVPQAGCEAGDACDFGSPATGPFECRDVTANGTADSRCTDATECAAGFTCIGGGGNKQSCMRFCNDDTGCGFGARCVGQLRDENDQLLPQLVCSNACDIISQTGCPTGYGCLGVEDGAKDFSDCFVMGTKLDGAACTSTIECLPGSVCVNVDGARTCHSYCDQSDPQTCGLGETCSAFAVALEINATVIGFCE